MRYLALTLCFITFYAQAQQGSDTLRKPYADSVLLSKTRFPYLDQVKQFYVLTKQANPWIQQKPLQGLLIQLLQDADRRGLSKQDYQVGLLDSVYANLVVLKTLADTLYADALFTHTAIHFFHDVSIGNIDQPVSYPGFRYIPDCLDIPGLLALAVGNNQLGALPDALEPATPEYKAVKSTLHELLAIMKDSAANNSEQQSLAQKLAGLGIVRQTIPGKIRELNHTLNTLRWARCVQEVRCILVNIPSATLQYYVGGTIVLQSKVIVGKRSTPTSTLSSNIQEIVLYPYWTVPSKIARRELFPLIKNNPAYLDDNGFQVINAAGKVVDPATVDWKKYSSAYFPFVLRQSTGCDNSLGIVKLNFYSPYGIYLHDTPWKSLFNASRRYLSHGCVRVERVNELARLLLDADSTTFNEIIQKGDSLNTTPTTLPLNKAVPVIILYNTAWTDMSGTVRFYDDVYRKAAKIN